MRIAVIGAGVSGCLAARLLATRHDVVLFDANRHAGGHAFTRDAEVRGSTRPADVGFMVFNRRTYPNFCRLLDSLGVESRPSDMSFSVQDPSCGLEYQGSGLRGLFAQRSNAVRPSFLRMVRDILRFNRLGRDAAAEGSLREDATVGEFIDRARFGGRFVRHYLQPMAAAIWSCNPSKILEFPSRFLIGFFANHGLLQLRERPQWRTIVGGSRVYVESLLKGLGDRVRLADAVAGVSRATSSFEVRTESGGGGSYEQVVFATHADTTLRLFEQATRDERDVLGALPYQPNRAVLHTDASALPKRRDAWASWNYRLTDNDTHPASVTYDLGRLQGIAAPGELLLTLNEETSIDPTRVIERFEFTHPAYTPESVRAQRRWAEISGRGGVHYCGAYWGYGFHEDGVNSALAVARNFGIGIEACTAACTKAS